MMAGTTVQGCCSHPEDSSRIYPVLKFCTMKKAEEERIAADEALLETAKRITVGKAAKEARLKA